MVAPPFFHVRGWRVAYSHTTFTEAENQLASLLADSSKVRFLSAELRAYLTESLRTWNALTGMFKVDGAPIDIAAGTAFIDLPTEYPDYRAYTVTDRDLVSLIQYHFLEPATPTAWSGTEMFTLTEIAEALERRRDQFLLETFCRVTRTATYPTAPDVVPPGTLSYDLPENVVALRRLAWRELSGKVTPLQQSSSVALRGANPLWTLNADVPKTYMYDTRSPHTIALSPVPANAGSLDIIAVATGADLDPSSNVAIGIPDDLCWGVKWGAMATLLSKDGPARDYARALYCERRYRLAVVAALMTPTLTDGRVGNRPMQFATSLDSLDQARRHWQTMRGTLQTVAPAGHNLVALASPPSTDIQASFSFVRNAPIPALVSDYLQIGKEYLDLVIGYSVHLAMFKIGGTEFASTTHFADSFFAAASEYNERLKESSAFEEATIGRPESKATQRGVRRVTGGTVE
jgi:hypothetical protein